MGGLRANVLVFVRADFAALSSQFDSIELSSFSGDALASVQTQGAALRGASSTLQAAASSLRSCLRSNTCKTIIAGVIGSITVNEILNPLNWLVLGGPDAVKPTQTLQPPSSPTGNTTSTDTPLPWLLNTRSGTSLGAFKSFIQSLPDKGSGRQIVYETLSTQWYVTSMTLEEAMIVHQFPIVDQMVPNTPLDYEVNEAKGAAARPLRPRDGPTVVAAPREVPWHLKWLSARRTRDVVARNLDNDKYIYEENAGQGSYVYLFDAKVDWDHIVNPDPQHLIHLGNTLLT